MTLAIVHGVKGRMNRNVPAAYITNVRAMVIRHLMKSGGSLLLIQLCVMLRDATILPQLVGANLV